MLTNSEINILIMNLRRQSKGSMGMISPGAFLSTDDFWEENDREKDIEIKLLSMLQYRWENKELRGEG